MTTPVISTPVTSTPVASTPVMSWRLPAAALRVSAQELAADGALGREGIALWAGRRSPDDPPDDPPDGSPDGAAAAAGGDAPLAEGAPRCARVTDVVLLRGPGIRRTARFIEIRPELLNDVTSLLASLPGEPYLVGQIHGHPPGASTDLSPTDVAYGIQVPWFLSVVAPDFAMGGALDVARCGVHVCQPSGPGARPTWHRLSAPAVAARVRVVRDADVAVHSVTWSP